jgi:hypothetical protein
VHFRLPGNARDFVDANHLGSLHLVCLGWLTHSPARSRSQVIAPFRSLAGEHIRLPILTLEDAAFARRRALLVLASEGVPAQLLAERSSLMRLEIDSRKNRTVLSRGTSGAVMSPKDDYAGLAQLSQFVAQTLCIANHCIGFSEPVWLTAGDPSYQGQQALRVELIQQLSQGLSSCPTGRRPGVKIDRCLLYRALSSGTTSRQLIVGLVDGHHRAPKIYHRFEPRPLRFRARAMWRLIIFSTQSYSTSSDLFTN